MTSGTDKEWNQGREHDEYRIEVFTPPYLMKDSLSEIDRPIIKNVKMKTNYDEVISIESDQAEEIHSVTVIRPSSVTHSQYRSEMYRIKYTRYKQELPYCEDAK
jgi:hypothetical protein